MQYIPPYGSSDPEAPFVDRNTATATRGSAVPAEFFNVMQAEVLAVIEGAGLATDPDSLQLAPAIQSQRMNFAEASGSPDAIALSVNPAPAAYAAIRGMPIVALMSASPTGSVTINLNGMGPKDVRSRHGAPVSAGEWSAGDIVAFCYDGVRFQVLGTSTTSEKHLVHVGEDVGSANTIVATVDPPVSSYAVGSVYSIKVGLSITGASTASFGGGVRPITRADGSPTKGGDLIAGQAALFVYDGAAFQIANFSPANIPAKNTLQFLASDNFTVPADVYRVKARVWAGGGGGGGSHGASGAGSGGGGGGYAEGIIAVTPGQVIPVTVGAGGAGGTSVPTNGAAGGTSSFGTYVSATGGGGGYAGNNALQTTQAGVGGTGTGAFPVGGTGAGIAFLVGTTPAAGIGGSAGMGSGSPTISIGGVGAGGLFPGGGANGGSIGSFAGGVGGSGLVVIEY